MNETIDLSRATWFKSSYSNGQGGACVETAVDLPGNATAIRDSKHPDGPALLFSASQWHAFIHEVKHSDPE